MKMTENDWKLYSVTNAGAFVVAAHGTNGMTWPTIINDEKTGKKFKFAHNETMPDWMTSHWGGYARYDEVPEDEGI